MEYMQLRTKVLPLFLITFGLFFYELHLVLAGKSLQRNVMCVGKRFLTKKDHFYAVNVGKEIVRWCFGAICSGEENGLSLCSSCYRALNKYKENGKCFPKVSA